MGFDARHVAGGLDWPAWWCARSAANGQQPWTFLVDGGPLPQANAWRDARRHPPGPGIHRVSVIETEGDAPSATIRIRAE